MAKREFNIPTVIPGEGLDDEQFQAVVQTVAEDAVHYVDEWLAPEREQATAFYRGDLFGNEEEGRSQIVMTEVRDIVQSIMPSLLRVFCGTERVAEFQPRTEQDVAGADQATEYCNYILNVDNPGFKILHDVFKDALIRKTGIFKWYKEDVEHIEESDYSGLTEEQLSLLANEDDIEVLSYEEEPAEAGQAGEAVDPQTGEALAPEPTFKARLRRYRNDQKFVVEAVPPEEFLVARDARSEDHATFIGHRRLLPIADLVAMGYDLDEVVENAGTSDGFELNNEAQSRNPAAHEHTELDGDPMMREVLYTEGYLLCDKEGDGIALRRKVCTIGSHYYVLHDEVWDDMVPFAVLCPDPEAHMLIGYSMADQTKDLQLIKSSIVRNTLDSLAGAIHPKTAVVETQVNMDDVLNNEVGGVIRMRAPGMVQDMSTPFVGQAAMPIIAYFDQIKAARTGISAASQGLDPDAMQSTTKAAVNMVNSGAAQRLEMIARVFAETGIKRLMRGLLRMVVRHQDKKRLVKLRGEFVPVDPRYWDADMDVIINPALGVGNTEERMMHLSVIATAQKEIIATAGMDNPICGPAEVRNTYAKMCEIAGIRDVSRYFKQVTPETMAAWQQAQAAKAPADPNAMLAQVEAEKIKADISIAENKMLLEFVKTKMEDDRKRDEQEAETRLRASEIEAKYGAQVDMAAMQREADRDRNLDSSLVNALTKIQTTQMQGEQAVAAPPTGAPE